ncbi:hypothetical protein QEN19_001911 [Hanseniaspora menglaensis]
MLYLSFWLLLILTTYFSTETLAKFVELPFFKQYGSNYETKRELTASVINDISFYQISMNIGSDMQPNNLLVDTGSSDSFLLSSQFNFSTSSTFHNNNSEFLVNYGSGTVTGFWGKDLISLNGQSIGKLSFGITKNSSVDMGLLGLGLSGLESTYSNSLDTSYQYSNFPIMLKENGCIDATIFHVFLGEETSATGTFLFGAVDTSKAKNGVFYELPMINTENSIKYDTPIKYIITVQGMGTIVSTKKTSITTTKQAALIDTGSTLTMVNSFILDSIMDNLNAQSNSNGFYSVSCNTDDNIVVDFGGFQINIPVNQTFIGHDGDQCFIGIASTAMETMIFGDTFIRAMSIVFDLDNYVIGIAEANFNDELSAIVNSSGGIPNGVKAIGYNDTYVSYSEPVSGGNIFSTNSLTRALNSVNGHSNSFSSTGLSSRLLTTSSSSEKEEISSTNSITFKNPSVITSTTSATTKISYSLSKSIHSSNIIFSSSNMSIETSTSAAQLTNSTSTKQKNGSLKIMQNFLLIFISSLLL